MLEYAPVIDMGMGLGSAELDWDSDNDMDSILGRSGRELREAFILEPDVELKCCAEEREWGNESVTGGTVRVCMLCTAAR